MNKRPSYIVVKSPVTQSEKTVELDHERPFRLGNTGTNDLVIPVANGLQYQVEIRVERGRYWLENMRPGTALRVNDDDVTLHVLENNDRIAIGSEIELRFHHYWNDPVFLRKLLDETTPVLIQVDDEDHCLKRYSIEKPVVSIGRSRFNCICLEHRTISRHHCEIVEHDNQLYIADLKSSNGIRINDCHVEKQHLSNGDLVEIGFLQFRVVLPNSLEDTVPRIQSMMG